MAHSSSYYFDHYIYTVVDNRPAIKIFVFQDIRNMYEFRLLIEQLQLAIISHGSLGMWLEFKFSHAPLSHMYIHCHALLCMRESQRGGAHK